MGGRQETSDEEEDEKQSQKRKKTSAQNKARADAKREKYHAMSQEEREALLASKRQRRSKATPAQRKARADAKREKYYAMSQEERDALLASKRQRRSKTTPAQRKARADAQREKYHAMSQEEREALLASKRQRRSKATPAQRKARADAQREKYYAMSQEEREALLATQRQRRSEKKADADQIKYGKKMGGRKNKSDEEEDWTPQKRKRKKTPARPIDPSVAERKKEISRRKEERRKLRKQNETPEERAIRLQKQRESQLKKIAKETLEEAAVRKARQAENKKRSNAKITPEEAERRKEKYRARRQLQNKPKKDKCNVMYPNEDSLEELQKACFAILVKRKVNLDPADIGPWELDDNGQLQMTKEDMIKTVKAYRKQKSDKQKFARVVKNLTLTEEEKMERRVQFRMRQYAYEAKMTQEELHNYKQEKLRRAKERIQNLTGEALERHRENMRKSARKTMKKHARKYYAKMLQEETPEHRWKRLLVFRINQAKRLLRRKMEKAGHSEAEIEGQVNELVEKMKAEKPPETVSEYKPRPRKNQKVQEEAAEQPSSNSQVTNTFLFRNTDRAPATRKSNRRSDSFAANPGPSTICFGEPPYFHNSLIDYQPPQHEDKSEDFYDESLSAAPSPEYDNSSDFLPDENFKTERSEFKDSPGYQNYQMSSPEIPKPSPIGGIYFTSSPPYQNFRMPIPEIPKPSTSGGIDFIGSFPYQSPVRIMTPEIPKPSNFERIEFTSSFLQQNYPKSIRGISNSSNIAPSPPHAIQNRNPEPITPIIRNCQHCSTHFTSTVDLKTHIRSSHPEKCCKCPKCKEIVTSPQELTEHFKAVHQTPTVASSTKSASKQSQSSPAVFTCMKCPPAKSLKCRYSSLEALSKHVKRSHPKSFWPCSSCKVLKYSESSLNFHLKVCQSLTHAHRK